MDAGSYVQSRCWGVEGKITHLGQLPQSIPAHLVEVVPEIRLDGEVVHTGSRLNLGAEIDFNFSVRQLGYGDDSRISPVVAGSYLALAVAGGSVAPNSLETLQQQVELTKNRLESGDRTQIASLTREDLLGDLFHAGTLAYFGQFDALASLQARQQKAQQNLAASAGTYGYEPEVEINGEINGVSGSMGSGSMGSESFDCHRSTVTR